VACRQLRARLLDEFWIGQYDVTNAQYAAYARATGRAWTMPASERDHPVTDVSWDDAVAFCRWVSRVTGRQVQLPTEAQWEKAARGTDGREFPWGNEAADPTRRPQTEPGGSYAVAYSPSLKGRKPVWSHFGTFFKVAA
jgi:formylglycine-generating enzyme required for sulfatase activity